MGWNEKSIHLILKGVKKDAPVTEVAKPVKVKKAKKPSDAETKAPADGENE